MSRCNEVLTFFEAQFEVAGPGPLLGQFITQVGQFLGDIGQKCADLLWVGIPRA